MAVAIQILSGSRQGERLEFDVQEFRAGDAPSCEVFFNPLREPGARGRTLLFQLGDEGWVLRNLGAPGVIVNEQTVAGQVHLRSGDVVRLSASGPDVSFQLIAHLSPRPAAGPIMPTVPAPTMLPSSSGNPSWPAMPAVPVAPVYAPQPPTNVARPSEAAASEAAAPAAAKTGGAMAARASLLIAGLALAVAMLLLVQQFPQPSGDGRSASTTLADRPQANARTSTSAVKNKDQGAEDSPIGESVADKVGDGTKSGDKTADDKTPASSSLDAKTVAQDVRSAIWLVTVEEPKTHTAWPIAVAAAVRQHTAVTSATVIAELKRFQSKGWKVWLMRPDEDRRLAVSDLRLHIGFASAVGDPETQIFDDFGLLTIDRGLDPLVAVADGEERAGIEQGMPLACLTITFEWEPVTKYQTYEPVFAKGKVRAVTVMEPGERDSPRLVHAALDMPSKAYGSPVLSSAGHLLGVYAETVPKTDEIAVAGPALQYVPVFDGRWLDDKQWWVEPTSQEAANEANEP